MDKIKSIVEQLSLEEKASLCSGKNDWQTQNIDRLDIPSIWVADGPHGLRVNLTDEFFHSEPATCFPTASALGASWNTSLLEEIGKTLGIECNALNVDILLGPGINIKRSPLGGRNFEYYSEDPFLTGALGTAIVKGVQSQGVGTCVKHFTANNQEFQRMSMSTEVDERSFREIYLPAFEMIVKEAKPWSLMCAYNAINGVLASENKYLLYDILKKEWNYEGIVISDWGAVHDRALGVDAGLHLEMPGNNGLNNSKIVEAVKNGTLSEDRLDEIVSDLLHIIFKAKKSSNNSFDIDKHHQLAKLASLESITLLKNEELLLPIQATDKIAIIGQFAKESRIQGGGSSNVTPTKKENLYDQLSLLMTNDNPIPYADGYLLNEYEYNESVDEENSDTLIAEAVALAQQVELAVLVVGLPDSFESESLDRSHIDLPANQTKLIKSVLAVQENTVVVLVNGSAVAMPWHASTKSIVEAWLGGQGGAEALAEILIGNENPSGKLSETFPMKLSDNPSFLNFPGHNNKVHYNEGIYIGYRYYEKKEIKPLFPFGHGLSYTTFQYEDIALSQKKISDTDKLIVTITINNSGLMTGKEVVQLYVKDKLNQNIRPEKELKAFQKIKLEKGESKDIKFELSKRAFAFYDVNINDWRVETGDFDILIGSSSADIRLITTVHVTSTTTPKVIVDKYITLAELKNLEKGKAYGEGIINNCLAMITNDIDPADTKVRGITIAFFTAILNDLPLYKLPAFTKNVISSSDIENICKTVNAS